MPYGVLPTGFSRKTVDVIKASLNPLYQPSSRANLTAESVLGQLVGIMSTKLGEVWEAQEAFASNTDPASAIGSWLRTIGSSLASLRCQRQELRSAYVYARARLALPANSIVASSVNASVRFFTRTLRSQTSGVAIADFAVRRRLRSVRTSNRAIWRG